MTSVRLVEHFFRREYSRLVAVLARRVGVRHIAAIEDAVQSALIKALELWTVAGLPDNPSGWLYRVAHNALLGELRQQSGRNRILRQAAIEMGSVTGDPTDASPEQAHDDLLRMLFACCEEAIPPESQLVVALKTLCGFSIPEIAQRLFISEANAYKRLGRARAHLQGLSLPLADLSSAQRAVRVPNVHRIIYAIFSEGYLSSRAGSAIRKDLCEEAVRLGTLLADDPLGRAPETAALLALMHFHLSRMSGRVGGSGGLLLLEEQDRTLWDTDRIRIGLEWLARSAHGNLFSRYHAEAGIAAEHCLAPSFRETRWERVVECYDLLQDAAPSPINRLNRAIAIAEWKGAAAGLASLDGFERPTATGVAFLWAATLADLNRRCGRAEEADHYRDLAATSAPTPALRALLVRRFQTEATFCSHRSVRW